MKNKEKIMELLVNYEPIKYVNGLYKIDNIIMNEKMFNEFKKALINECNKAARSITK